MQICQRKAANLQKSGTVSTSEAASLKNRNKTTSDSKTLKRVGVP
jgi:hypothetical protein